jgi:hypothetical protein
LVTASTFHVKLSALRFSPAMYQAILAGLKKQTRRPITAGNCRPLDRGEFKSIDFASGRPDGRYPVSCLRARVESASGERRSVLVQPKIWRGDRLWPRQGQAGEGAKKKFARFHMSVTRVVASRLQDISEEDALAEGVEIFCPPDRELWAPQLTEAMLAARLCRAYEFQFGQLSSKRRREQWGTNPVHQEMRARGRPSARDNFALLWESINGPGTWASNPWVWAITFEKVPPV